MIFPVFPRTASQIFMKGFRKVASPGKSNLIADLRNRQICRKQQLHPSAQAVIGQIGIGRLVDELPENGAAACLPNPSRPCDIGKADPFPVVLLNVRNHIPERAEMMVPCGRCILVNTSVLVKTAPDITDQALQL